MAISIVRVRALERDRLFWTALVAVKRVCFGRGHLWHNVLLRGDELGELRQGSSA